MSWDLFCRVVDNFGDVGVCWRLATGLARRGTRVRLWLDDASALAWMAPQGHPGVEVRPWHEAAQAEPAGTVVEAFGCDPPPSYVHGMVSRRPAPVWINLEYLSAEAYVERAHGLRSPQLGGPGAGLDKWFFYPGFTPRTGGLMRSESEAVDRHPLVAELGCACLPGERLALLFCYDAQPLPALLQRLAGLPVLLLAAPGPASSALAHATLPPGLRWHALPWLPQPRFDALLRVTDLNFVRGEDSFVQAQWSGAPFVWQLYPQHDGAHASKLEAFLARFLGSAGDAPEAERLRAVWRAWNGLGPWPDRLPEATAWQAAAGRWRDGLLGQTDLITQLLAFANARR